MKKKLSCGLGVLCIFQASVAWAGNMGALASRWHPVIGVGGGSASAVSLGRYQNFPIINPVTDQYFNYSPRSGTHTQWLAEAFLGAEKQLYSNWRLQAGFAYAHTGTYQAKGTFIQGADPQSSDQYTYKYNVSTQQIMAQAKLLYQYNEILLPYMLLGLGGAINSASNYSTNVPPFLTFTQMYANNTTSSFAFRVGVGFDVNVASNTRLGLAYRFSDLGGVSLGSANIIQIPVPGTLSQANLYANEVLLQLTYVA